MPSTTTVPMTDHQHNDEDITPERLAQRREDIQHGRDLVAHLVDEGGPDSAADHPLAKAASEIKAWSADHNASLPSCGASS